MIKERGEASGDPCATETRGSLMNFGRHMSFTVSPRALFSSLEAL